MPQKSYHKSAFGDERFAYCILPNTKKSPTGAMKWQRMSPRYQTQAEYVAALPNTSSVWRRATKHKQQMALRYQTRAANGAALSNTSSKWRCAIKHEQQMALRYQHSKPPKSVSFAARQSVSCDYRRQVAVTSWRMAC